MSLHCPHCISSIPLHSWLMQDVPCSEFSVLPLHPALWRGSCCVACVEITWKSLFIGCRICQGLITGSRRRKYPEVTLELEEGGVGLGQDGVSIWVALLLIHSALLWLHCQETFSLALDDDPPLPVMLPQLPLQTNNYVPPHNSQVWRHGQRLNILTCCKRKVSLSPAGALCGVCLVTERLAGFILIQIHMDDCV